MNGRIIKVGIIGSGFMGTAHVEQLQRIGGVKVTAIASDDPDSANVTAKKYDVPNVYENWEDIIGDKEIEVVHNCTPNYLHFEINKAVIKKGKHILSEKPLTITSKESAELLELLEKHNVANAVNYNYRFYPLLQHAKSMIEENEVGEIFLVHGHYLQDWLYLKSDYNWRLESELSGESRAVADIGSHWCDMVQFLTGSKITEVFADLTTIHKKRNKPKKAAETFKGKEETANQEYDELEINTEDTASVLLHFENGARGSFTVSQVSAGRKNNFQIEIDGSRKALAWNQEEPNQLWIGHREKGNEVIIKDPALMNPGTKKYAHYPGGHPEGYPDTSKNLFINFYDYIRKGKDPISDEKDFPTFDDGHKENLIVEAILKSSKENNWINVE